MSFTRCLFQAVVVAAAASTVFAGQRVELQHLPPAVQHAVHDQTRGATLVGLSKERQRGRVVYEVETTVNGHTRDVLLSATGAVVVVEEEVGLETVPAEVAAALTARGKVLKVELVTAGATTTYEAQVESHGKTTEVIVDPHGRIPRRKVTSPPPADDPEHAPSLGALTGAR